VFGAAAVIRACADGSARELLTFPFRDVRFAAATVFQGLGSGALAFFLSNAAIARIGVNRCASFIDVSTFVSIAAGALLLGERLSSAQAVGAVIIVAGVMIANVRTKP
ncbi:MAG: EamA family transporter, partial [Pyramidobacter sp.]|nr:EamA family transporter [Pyramidobacter sp.]